MREEYNKEDLRTDVDWLIGLGVGESEAEDFIMNLINSEWKE